MKRLLFFASDYAIGLSSLLVDEALAFQQAGIRMKVLCGDTEQEPGLFARLESCGIDYKVIPALDKHARFSALRDEVRDCISEYGADVVHVQNNWQLALVAAAKWTLAKSERPEVIYTLHGYRHNHFFKAIIARAMIGTALLLFADRVICMCTFLSREFSLLSYKTEVLPLGVSDVFFNETPLPDINDVGLQIIYPAQFREGKNQDSVIRAFALYLEKTGDTKSHLTLPGSGPTRDEVGALIAELGLEDRVSLPGQCTKLQVAAYYAQANVAIVASNRETYGQSIVEPFAMGRVVMSRRVGIAPDIVKNGVNGYLFDSEQELATLFWNLAELADDSTLSQLSLKARHDALPLKWDRVAQRYQDILKRI